MIDEKLKEIGEHPEWHKHNYHQLVLCCLVDGILNATLMQAHAGTAGTNGGVKCDVIEGPCVCGAWHG